MFEKASRLKLRIESTQGLLNIEDLWDLPLLSRSKSKASLDEVYKHLNRKLKDTEEESIIVKTQSSNSKEKLMFEIVKHIIGVKLAEKEAAEKAEEVKAKKERILAILADKEDEELLSKGKDELRALLAGLE